MDRSDNDAVPLPLVLGCGSGHHQSAVPSSVDREWLSERLTAAGLVRTRTFPHSINFAALVRVDREIEARRR